MNSVYEDENIKLEIYNEMLYSTNLTKKTIFIDLSQCFLVNNGSSYPMWTTKTDEKKASRVGVSLSEDAFITIAPATGGKQNATFICNMSASIFGKYTSTEGPSGDFSDYDKRFINLIAEMVDESKSQDPKGMPEGITENQYINVILKEQLSKCPAEQQKSLTREIADADDKVMRSQLKKRIVWFQIIEFEGKYTVVLCYDNGYNHHKGDNKNNTKSSINEKT